MKKLIRNLAILMAFILSFSAVSVNSVADSVLLGDVNGNGSVGIDDVLAIKQYVVGKIKTNDIVFANADVDKSSTVDLADMLYIRKYLANILSSFTSVCVDSNLLDDVYNQDVTAENLGTPAVKRYGSSSYYYYARNIWDMATVDGKVLITMGDYGNNTGSVPIYYFTNDSSTAKESSYLSPRKTAVDGLSSEEVKRFFKIDGELYAVATDPLGMGQGSYYKFDSKTNTWQDYYNLALNVHCYDMIEYDGKIFFGGMTRDQSSDKWINGCVQYVQKDKLTSSTSLTSLSKRVNFYYADGTEFTSEKYVSTFDGKTYYKYDYWRVYNMFIYKNELYATHINSASYSMNAESGLFKYDKDSDRFVQVYDGTVTKSIMSVLRNYTIMSHADKDGKYVSTAIPAHYGFDDNILVDSELKNGTSPIYSEPTFTATFSFDNKFIGICNDIFKSSDLKTFEKVSLGADYENFVVRDAFELDGKYYILASAKNSTEDYTTVVLETDENFASFRKVLSLKTQSFARSFVYNGGYLYFGLGSDGSTDGIGNLGINYSNKYSGTVLRVDLSKYMK